MFTCSAVVFVSRQIRKSDFPKLENGFSCMLHKRINPLGSVASLSDATVRLLLMVFRFGGGTGP